MYRNLFRDFLHVDLEGNISNTLDVSTKSKINEYLSSLFEGSELATRENTFDEYMKTTEKKEVIMKSVLEIAVSATTIPLSIFTNLFHQRFSKHDYLESTLEMLQQFYIKMHSYHNYYCLLPGDLCKYTFKCVRCHASITTPGTIGETLYHAPSAIVRHLEMIDHQDHPINPTRAFNLSQVPVLFSGMDTYVRGEASFLESVTKIGDNDHDGMFFCYRANDLKKGEHEFCEAVKVDVSKAKETTFQASITNTIALVSVLFEEIGVAVEIHEMAKKEKKSEVKFPSGHLILFNNTFSFEQGFFKTIINSVQKECLKSLEALCVFGYREFYKNFLLILVEMNDQISRKKTPVPKRIMDMFGVSTGPLVAHMLKRAKFETTKFSQAYRVETNSSHLIVGNSTTRPVQYSLGALPSGAAFTEKQGHGWNPTNVAEFFQVSTTDEDNGEIRKEQKMISSKQFEAHHIMLFTMRSIKVTKVKNSGKKQFHIQCQAKNYQYGNSGIRQRHPTTTSNNV
jgi:hypothetical protein